MIGSGGLNLLVLPTASLYTLRKWATMADTVGSERTFEQGDNKVRACPMVDNDIIQRVIITHMDGDRRKLEQMVRDIKTRYTGASYSAVWGVG